MKQIAFKVWKTQQFAREFYWSFAEFYAVLVRKFGFDFTEADAVKYVNSVEKEFDIFADSI